MLEIQGLLNLASSAFECEICGAEIEEHTEDTVKVKATQETLSLFSEQTVPIVRLLKKIDTIEVPPYIHVSKKMILILLDLIIWST